jgi:UDP-2,3-diacylglucosamine hydrolase
MTATAEAQARPLGILAGNGSLPREIAIAVRESGQGVCVVALSGDVDAGLAAFDPVQLQWGQIGRLIATLKAANCHDLVIVGGVSRPDLNTIRPDWGLIANLPQLLRLVLSGGDDGVLRAMIRFLESKGFRVVSPASVAPNLLVGAGALGALQPGPDDAADMIFGSSVVRALGAYDIGQAVVVCNGRIEAIEAVEGTDRMIARVVAQRQGTGVMGAPRGVLVKRPKPNQEMRIDLPTIGPNTVAQARAAGLAGIAVLAGQTLAAERAHLVRDGDAAGLFVYGFSEREEGARASRGGVVLAPELMVRGRLKPTALHRRDVVLGARVLGSLAGLQEGGIAVVHRGHVLALEPEGRTAGALGRVGQLKQWGEGRWRRRAGVAVLGEGVALTAEVVSAAAGANLAGVAWLGRGQGVLLDDACALADQQRLFVASVRADGAIKAGG